MNGDRPLVTFALFAYNQERFVRDAVAGAFAQTYSPLEIILSDDCSVDGTYRLMQELAAAYRGPHAVVLNRNGSNLGLGRHVSKVMAMSRGEFVVVAAGDDISLPRRTDALFGLWSAQGRPSAVCSETIAIDESGLELPESPIGRRHSVPKNQAKAELVRAYLRGSLPMVLGCSAAYSRNVFEIFGEFPKELFSEDYVASLRAWFLEGVAFSDERLVMYRRHEGSMTNRPAAGTQPEPRHEARLRYIAEELGTPRDLSRRVASMYDAAMVDIDSAVRLGLASDSASTRLKAIIAGKREISLLRTAWWHLGAVDRAIRFASILPLAFSPDYRDERGKLKWMLPRLLGLNLFCTAKAVVRGSR